MGVERRFVRASGLVGHVSSWARGLQLRGMGVRWWCAPPEVAVDEDEEEHLKDVRALELGLGAVVLELGHHARDGAEEEELETHHAEAVERAWLGLGLGLGLGSGLGLA